MDESHSLLLNEEAFDACPEGKRPVFIYEWLRYLDRILPITQREDLRNVQKELQQQLESRLHTVIGPPTRKLISRCIARVYLLSGDTSSLLTIINSCNDTLRVKDESPKQVNSKLAALACLSALYDTMGRLVGRSFEETLAILQKWMKSAESHSRAHIMNTLTSMVKGLGNCESSAHKDIYKLAKSSIQDRSVFVKIAAVECLVALVGVYTPLYTTELEASCTLCIKILDGSSYELRCAIAKFMSQLLATSMKPPPGAVIHAKSNQTIAVRPASVADTLNLLSSGFVRGGIGGFLKGNSSNFPNSGGLTDVRIGVAICYVEMMREMGSVWLEKHLVTICCHLVDLASKCGHLAYTQSNTQITEALILRRCVSFILRQTIGSLLGENAQTLACKHLGTLLSQYGNSVRINDETDSEIIDSDLYASAYATIVILQEISVLVRQIGSSVMPLFVEATEIMEHIFGCLIHPIASARYATAWCLRCIASSVPNLMTPLIDRCILRLEQMKSSSDAICGYSKALAALLAASNDSSKLGIPHSKPLKILDLATDMLKTSAQQSRLTIAKLEAGWNLLYALVSLGSSVMKDHIHKVVLMWKAAFPRSGKEAESETNRGDAFSWQCSMIGQAGALSVMQAVAQQPELCSSSNALESMKVPIECSLMIMSQVGNLIRSFGNKMRQLNSIVRIRVYRLLQVLPHKSFEGIYVSLLRELVADITLSDNSQSTLTTSIPMSTFQGVEKILISPIYQSTDYSMVEDILCFSPSTSFAIGNIDEDRTNLIRGSASRISDTWPENQSEPMTCLNTALLTYGKVFPLVANKHKIQITEHFGETVKNCKNSARQQAILVNILTAKMLALKTLSEHRGLHADNEVLQKACVALILPALSNPCPMTRLLGAESLARLCQAVGSPQLVASMAQYCFNQLKSSRDAINRSGHVLALGCLHRHVGSLGSGQHLNTGVSVVLALAQETSSPNVQTCALVSMALIAETGGGMFRGFVETVLSVCLKLLISTPTFVVDVVQGISKLLTALITCVGPELSCPGVIDGVRTSLLAACAIQLSHSDPFVQAEAISGLQQMHLFAPRYVHMDQLVTDICSLLSSTNLVIRKQAISCLRQLVQREAKEVRNHAQVLVPQGIVDSSKKKFALPENGLEGALFGMLDTEINNELRSHVKETLVSLVQGTSGELLNNWLSMCKEILATSNDHSGTNRRKMNKEERSGEEELDEDGEDDGDDDTNLAGIQTSEEDKGKVQPRWPTKVFTMEIVNRLMSVCDTERAHLDMALAKELQMTSAGKNDYLVLHLSDLVRMSFMAATSDNSQLRIAGLKSLEEVIVRFSSIAEPEFPGHMILEQFQAQVGAALRPAFSDDTPSNVTSVACQVCSTWIGSGVARDLNDLKRVHQLLVSSLSKLKHGSINVQLYSESAATLEKLSILKAWAEVYVTSVEQENRKSVTVEDDMNYNSTSGSLLSLVEPETSSLIVYWLAALNDSALLALPPHYSEQFQHRGGAFFTSHNAEMCREYYQICWPPILLASSIWLSKKNFVLPSSIDLAVDTAAIWKDDGGQVSRFYLLLGIAIESLSNRTRQIEDETIQMTVKSLTRLLSCEWCQLHLMSDVESAVEILYVLHRIVLTRENLSSQIQCVECVSALMDAAQLAIRVSSSRDVSNGNLESENTARTIPNVLFEGGEGGSDGKIVANNMKTISYAALELCICVIFKQMPQINSATLKSNTALAALHLRKVGRLPVESSHLLIRSMQILTQIPNLCSPEGKVTVLPVILYILLGFIRESARIDENSTTTERLSQLSAIATAAIQSIRNVVSQAPEDETLARWKTIMRNAFFSVLNMSEDNERVQLDKSIIMLAAVVFATNSSADVVLAHQESFNKLIVLLKRQLNSESVPVVIKTLQSLGSIFARKGLGGVFVKHLGKEIMPLVKRKLEVDAITDSDVAIMQECVKVIEILAMNANETKRLSVIALLVQLLVRLLRATSAAEWRKIGVVEKKMHEIAIGRLNAAASMWPVEFKKIINCNNELKTRLESALLLQTTRHANQSTKIKSAETKPIVHQPKIKLTMFGTETA